MKNRYRAIFFDAGDTLIYAPLEEIFVDICRKYGVTLTFEKVTKAYEFFARNDDFFQRNKKLYDENPDNYWNLCNKYMLEFLGVRKNAAFLAKRITNDFPSLSEIEWKVFSDVPDTLAKLKQKGFILGVISNFDLSLENTLIELGLACSLDVIVASEKVGYSKPDPKIFLSALEGIGIEPEEVIYVGDNYDSDVVGSRLVGLTPVLIDRKCNYGEVDCLKINSLSELTDLLWAETF